MAGGPKQEKGGGKRGGGPRPLAASLGGVAKRTLAVFDRFKGRYGDLQVDDD